MSLGLGSRSGTPRRIHTPLKSSSTALVPVSASRPSSSRRGFGLFDDSDDEEMEQLSPAQPVKFSGDTSGFTGLRQQEPAVLATRSGVMGSRNKRATPGKNASARSTPYSTSTTGRALMRAKGQQQEDPILGESIFKSTPPHQEAESGTDEEVTRKKTPSKRLFQASPPSTTPTPRKDQQEEDEEEGDKTWGEWISNFVPDSIKKPVSKVLASTPLPKKSKRDIFLKTPEQDVNALAMPGSFEKPADKKPHNFINPNFMVMDKHQTTPIPNPELFVYDHSFSASSPSRESKLPSKSSAMAVSTQRQVTPAGTFRKPSNFISRMKSTPGKKTPSRFTPYGRRSTPRKTPAKELTPEEELELLEQRERDRKVQEAEDKYKRRETLRKLGKDLEDEEDNDSAMTDVTSPVKTPSKGKGRATSVEDTEDLGEPLVSTTPPSTPPKSASKVTPKMPSKSSLFDAAPPRGPPLFEPTPPPRGPPLFEPTPPSVAPTSPPKDWPTDSDKENTNTPPPPPTMSHRQLPAAPAAAPPPVPETTGLGLPHALGGHGLAAPEPPGARARNLLNKHKPRVSSSLRESSTYAKENDDDTKENPTASSSSTSARGMFKSGSGLKSFGGTVNAAPVQGRTAGALREASANAPAATVKVDIASKVAQLPVGDLFNVLLFPPATPVGSSNGMAIKNAVEKYWAPKEEWGGAIFEGVRAGSVMV